MDFQGSLLVREIEERGREKTEGVGSVAPLRMGDIRSKALFSSPFSFLLLPFLLFRFFAVLYTLLLQLQLHKLFYSIISVIKFPHTLILLLSFHLHFN